MSLGYEIDSQSYVIVFTPTVTYNADEDTVTPIPRLRRLLGLFTCRPSKPIPQIKLVVHLDTYYQTFLRSADGSLTSVSDRTFTGRNTDFLVSSMNKFLKRLEAATRQVLSFPGVDLYAVSGPEIASRVRETVNGLDLSRLQKLMIEATIRRSVRLIYDERSTVDVRERKGEEEGHLMLRDRVERSLEEKEWEETDEGGSGSTCTVCLELFGFKEKVARMQCTHCFHKSCIKKWLIESEGNKSCPTCRFAIDSCH